MLGAIVEMFLAVDEQEDMIVMRKGFELERSSF